ncbi:dual 3',5'-cyclic-AMP and -GMP phosphodiesterase 11 [Caerostris extrusa]|uniref:Dual 3',5'-cyclic-AMP and -GMP phosphodiesterase 11 n=1 Tax=Caerostris extrusa TaxID=172846 RepID=A0AAV4VQ84_CAEEX|nr:dual 3',5'-cyclic-AMP and -GMP phosphodiesterase 11 [Caerostris extrusa]
MLNGRKDDPGLLLAIGLVSQLLDVSWCSIVEQVQRSEEICISWDTGIAGQVVSCREFNTVDCYKVLAIFCGLGINIQMYERTMKAIAKTKVSLEVLSYHATAPLEDIQELLRECHIPSMEMYKLHALKFDYFSLNDREMLNACFGMFMDLGFIQRFSIEYDKGNLFLRKMVREGNFNRKNEDNRELLRAMLMTACDISAYTKPWEIQKR